MYLIPCSYRPKSCSFHWHLWKYLWIKDCTKGDKYSNELQNTPSLILGKGIVVGSIGPTYKNYFWLGSFPSGTNCPTMLGDSLGHPMS